MKVRNIYNCPGGWKLTQLLVAILAAFTQSSCKKLIEIHPPVNQIIGQEIYNSDLSAASVLTGIYAKMSDGSFATGVGSCSVREGLSADELVSVADAGNFLTILYKNALTDQGFTYSELYKYIFKINSAIEGISASSPLTAAVRNQLLGEGKFLRAFCYFYLVNLYGDVALVTTTEFETNIMAPRAPKETVYAQMVKDLKEAHERLSDYYVKSDGVTATTERVRPNKAAATALLSRVYLYTSEWALAETEATKVISNTNTYDLETLENAFLMNNKEAIWQLQPVSLNQDTRDAMLFVLAPRNADPHGGPNGADRPVYLSDEIYNAFEVGDSRKTAWVNTVTVGSVTYPYPYKYKKWLVPISPRTEYLMVFRLAEQYLIRAEARAMQNKITGTGSAKEDLDVIRQRSGLNETMASDQPSMIDAIIQERKVELFTEWGHRWLDLKRTGRIDEVMKDVVIRKGTTWASYKALYPIPLSEFRNNPSMKGKQNPGYPEM